MPGFVRSVVRRQGRTNRRLDNQRLSSHLDPFPTAPLRTGLAAFTASGSPVTAPAPSRRSASRVPPLAVHRVTCPPCARSRSRCDTLCTTVCAHQYLSQDLSFGLLCHDPLTLLHP